MTDEEIKAQIGDKVTGQITSHSAEEVRRITAILRELGYRWSIMYADNGSCVVMFRIDP